MLPFSIISSTNAIEYKKVSSYDLGNGYLNMVDSTGNLYHYGYNTYGSFGTGSTDNATLQKWLKSSLDNVSTIFCNGARSSVAIRKDGSIWMCGTCSATQHGNAVSYSTTQYTWIDITATMPVAVSNIKRYIIGWNAACIVTNDGEMWSTGSSSVYSTAGTAVNGWKLCTFSGSISNVYISGYVQQSDFSIITDTSGYVYGCGNNSYRQISSASTSSYSTYTAIDPTRTYKSISILNLAWVGISTTNLIFYSGVSGVVNAASSNGSINSYNLTSNVYDVSVTTQAFTYYKPTASNLIFYAYGASNSIPYLNNNNASNTASQVRFSPTGEGSNIPEKMLGTMGIKESILVYNDEHGVRFYALGLLVGQQSTANANYIKLEMPAGL